MAELRNQIGSLVTEPQSLHAQRTGQSFFVDENTAPITNEGNLLSLMTMRDFYKNDEGKLPAGIKSIFDNVAREESRYMMSALAVLADKSQNSVRIQNKFGRDFDAAKSIAKLLKQKADEAEFENTLKPYVTELTKGRAGTGGRMIPLEQGPADAQKQATEALFASLKIA
jgi:hypothetical protein